jgi:hypothetical protein
LWIPSVFLYPYEDQAILLSAASQHLLKTYHPTSPPEDCKGAEKLAKKTLDNLNEDVLQHLMSNISKTAITSMRDTCARLTEKMPFLNGTAANIEKMLAKFVKQIMSDTDKATPLSKHAKLRFGQLKPSNEREVYGSCVVRGPASCRNSRNSR